MSSLSAGSNVLVWSSLAFIPTAATMLPADLLASLRFASRMVHRGPPPRC